MENIKLVIWDLDETFWQGTLSDNTSSGVHAVVDNIHLVRKLTDRGIINTICSKNNYQDAIDILSSNEFENINDYFVFKSIDWTPKGERIKKLISDMNLRPINCLFIDDNINNLKEAQYILPELNVCLYSDFNALLKTHEHCFIGKNDSNHSRLSQYKILEKKVNDKHQLSSNDNFLRQSKIRVFMIEDNLDLDRIYEMIHRNNQLNFTKNRISRSDVEKIFKDPTIKSGVVRVIDKYGDNGIVGCYALKDNELIQFVFSCRILGMGIEKYVYQKLNWPTINVQGDVASTLSKGEVVDYINVGDDVNSSTDNNIVKSNEKFIAYGECPLRPIWSFLQPKLKECKFNEITPRPSVLNLGRMFLLNDNQISEILNNNPMFHVEWTYDSDIKNKRFNYLLLSLYDEYLNYKYLNPNTNSIFYSPKLNENYEYNKKLIGAPVTLQDIKTELINLILNVPHNAIIFILTSSEVIFKSKGEDFNYKYSVESNRILEELAVKYSNIKLIDIRKYAKYETDFFEPVRNHYNREIGYYLASDIIKEVFNDNRCTSESETASLPEKYIEDTIIICDKSDIKLDYIFYICNFKLYFELKNYNNLKNQGYDFLIKLFSDRYEILSTDSYTINADIFLNGNFRVEVLLIKNNEVISKVITSKIEFSINNLSLFLDPNFKNYNNAKVIAQKFIEKNINNNKILQRQINQLFYVNNTFFSLSYYFDKIVKSKNINIYFECLDIAKIILMHFEKSSIKVNNIFSTKADFIYDEITNKRYSIKNINTETNLNENDCILLCGLSDVNSYEISSIKKNYSCCKFLWLDYVLSYLVTRNITSKFIQHNPNPSYIAIKVPDFNRYLKLTSNERVLINTNFNDVVMAVKEKNFSKLPQTLNRSNYEELSETLLSSEEIYDFKNCRYCDKQSTYMNVINGLRKTTNQPCKYVGTIYLIGNSKTFGIGVRDEHTIASELQKIISLPFKVVNYSNFYKEIYYKKGIDSLLKTKLKHTDIVVFLLHSEQTNFTNQNGQICWNGIDEHITTVDACDLINTAFRPDYFSLKETYTHEFNIALANRIKQAIMNIIE